MTDRLRQFKEEVAKSPQTFDINTYLQKYENTTQKKFTAEQLESAKLLDQKMKNCVAIGKFNIKEYKEFLKRLPYVLAGESVFLLGDYDRNGTFWNSQRDTFVLPSTYEITSKYSISSQFDKKILFGNAITSSPSIYKSMSENYRNKFCVLDIDKSLIGKVHVQPSIRSNEEKKIIGFVPNGSFINGVYFNENGITKATMEQYYPNKSEKDGLDSPNGSTSGER